MAETELSKTMPEGYWSQTGAVLTMTALDNANGNFFMSHRDCLIVVQNTSGSPQTFQVTSQPHPEIQRTGNIAQVMAAGEFCVFRLCRPGWADVSDVTHLPSGQSTALKVGIIPLDPITG